MICSAFVLSALLPVPVSAITQEAGGRCQSCHSTVLTGAHGEVACVDCHGPACGKEANAAGTGSRDGCFSCHGGYEKIFNQVMTSRAGEHRVLGAAMQAVDPGLFPNLCGSCHVADCLDCHGPGGHDIARPGEDACSRCHQGYFVGADYFGRAPREDSLRYQRGPEVNGEHYLGMAPDIHQQAGMGCGDCHSMKSLAAGERSSRTCKDCHEPDGNVPDHSITEHLTGMECSSCHAGWAAQEYGTFMVKITGTPEKEYFRVKRNPDSDYLKSAYLRKQDAPPLGVNGKGRISPIRPQFIAYFTEVKQGKVIGQENRMLTASWKAFSPHTIRPGGPMCGACHGNGRRFMLENEEDRIYEIDRDGLGLSSFWSREGQRVENGTFIPVARYEEGLSDKGDRYTRVFLKRWKRFLDSIKDEP